MNPLTVGLRLLLLFLGPIVVLWFFLDALASSSPHNLVVDAVLGAAVCTRWIGLAQKAAP